MQEPRQISLADDGEETLVTPRFDAEETNIAQPVVPLEADGRVAAKRPRLLALALVSALGGVVLGGAGLYFYQSRTAASAVAHEPSSTPPQEEAAQPSAAPTTEASNAPQPTPATNGVVKENVAAPETPIRAAAPKKETGRESAHVSETTPTHRKASGDEDARADAPRRGKKDEADDEGSAARSEQRPRRAIYDTQDPIPEDSSPAALRARRVEEGLRRAERIRERQRRRRENAARSRGGSIEDIFEGRP